METEVHAAGAADLYLFQPDNSVRVAPVQLTVGWNPLPVILHGLAAMGLRLAHRSGSFHASPPDAPGAQGDCLYLPPAVAGVVRCPDASVSAPRSEDAPRFQTVWNETVARAEDRRLGILAIGDWGWHYDFDELAAVEQASLRAAGFTIAGRHAPPRRGIRARPV